MWLLETVHVNCANHHTNRLVLNIEYPSGTLPEGCSYIRGRDRKYVHKRFHELHFVSLFKSFRQITLKIATDAVTLHNKENDYYSIWHSNTNCDRRFQMT